MGRKRSKKGTEKHLNSPVQAVCKGTGAKGGWSGGKGPSLSLQKNFNSRKGDKRANRAGQGTVVQARERWQR